MAATLYLPVNKDLGFAWIVPYKGQASFQLGYKGYVQLAQRSGQYENINVTEVYEGELEQFDRLTGRFKLSGKRTSEKVIGFAAYQSTPACTACASERVARSATCAADSVPFQSVTVRPRSGRE
jgi:phage RecT family recombinase